MPFINHDNKPLTQHEFYPHIVSIKTMAIHKMKNIYIMHSKPLITFKTTHTCQWAIAPLQAMVQPMAQNPQIHYDLHNPKN